LAGSENSVGDREEFMINAFNGECDAM